MTSYRRPHLLPGTAVLAGEQGGAYDADDPGPGYGADGPDDPGPAHDPDDPGPAGGPHWRGWLTHSTPWRLPSGGCWTGSGT